MADKLDSVKLSQQPFRHVVIDGLWDENLVSTLRDEFPTESDPRWIRYADPEKEVKLEGPSEMFGEAARRMVKTIEASSSRLAHLFGMPPLSVSTEGGGYHQTNVGGGLAVHADFNRSDDGLYRRLNVITYLNRQDEAVEGGALQLWDERGPAAEVAPAFNRTLIFETSDTSFHGHPTPVRGAFPRRSFAVYLFSEEAPANAAEGHSTIWHADGGLLA